METLDLRKQFKHLYQPSAKTPALVDVPKIQFLMLDGRIEPGHGPGTSPAFQEAIQAVYGVAYTLKFTIKLRKEDPIDYPVMALEALWFFDDGRFSISDPSDWRWTVMIMQPDAVTDQAFQDARAQARKKKPNPALDRVRLEAFHEGLCVQMMHIGPYATEPATVDKMVAFAKAAGYTLRGPHHEIYLGDPRRSAPEKLKTVVRHTVQKSE